MIIKIALILTIITGVAYYVFKQATVKMGASKLLHASITNEYPKHILILGSTYVICMVASVIAWIVAIVTF